MVSHGGVPLWSLWYWCPQRRDTTAKVVPVDDLDGRRQLVWINLLLSVRLVQGQDRPSGSRSRRRCRPLVRAVPPRECGLAGLARDGFGSLHAEALAGLGLDARRLVGEFLGQPRLSNGTEYVVVRGMGDGIFLDR